jgi:hypothetical protein
MSEQITESGTNHGGFNTGEEGPPGQHEYPGTRQDDPPRWHIDGGVLYRDHEVVAICRDHALAFFIAAVLRRFSHGRMLRDDEGDGFHDEADNPGPGIGGE